ncbi:putative RNA-directed DNA polymerase [Lupinus albus]|uniref:Putative RNA-directed DNA polymerase n=1 Tax=Lupinus albus TaxID=3870 RepID=A0A6A4Q2D2_LUPAL|nr:putative RNA-directed DNA polymerase [Lupinus albus]
MSRSGARSSSHVSDLNDRMFMTGCVFTLVGGPIMCRSLIQLIVSISRIEVEYTTTSEASKEVSWLIGMLKDKDI